MHDGGIRPAARFGSDESGRAAETEMCGFVTGLVHAGGASSSGRVAGVVACDDRPPCVRTYYREIPGFLQTLSYAGPGRGMLLRVDAAAPAPVTLEYPAE